MREPLNRNRLSLYIFLCLANLPGCGALPRDEWVAREAQHKKDHDRLETAFRDLETRFDNNRREMAVEKWCKDSKVLEFVGVLQAAIPGTCTAASVQSSLVFMKTQPYAISNLRRGERIKDLHPGRLGQLRELMEPQKLHASTRFIIMVQPSDDGSVAQAEAIQLGRALNPVLKSEAQNTNLPILGPYLLPCRLSGVPKRLYNRQEDAPLPNEPTEGMPRVRIWVFRTDC